MIKPVFADVPLFWIITIRLGAAVVSSVLMFLFVGEKIDAIRRVIYSPRRGMLLLACFLSTYVSMILWVAGYKFNDAGTTAILNQMSTIFTVVLAALFLKERLTATKLTGTALAMAGVLVMTLA
jgi:drug/metabolite transporter (DMT)-like permease